LFKVIVFIILFILTFAPVWVFAQEGKFSEKIDVLTGFGSGRLSQKGGYRLIPLFLDFNFAIKKKDKSTFPPQLDFVLEPFFSYVYNPDNNMEIGSNFLFKVSFTSPEARFQPYLKGGVGVIYMSQPTLEQATSLNFDDTAAVGIHYFFKENRAFTLEYRFRHISNAAFKSPNAGINTHFALFSLSYFF
jgi:hypothetical protein